MMDFMLKNDGFHTNSLMKSFVPAGNAAPENLQQGID